MAERQKFTKTFIDGLQPGSADQLYWDTETKGFGLKVTPKGRKVYLLMHRPKGYTGAAKKFTIGKHGDITVQQARARALEALAESQKGVDLAQTEKASARRLSSDLVKDLVSEFVEQHAKRNRTGAETKRILDKEFVPVIGRSSVHAITKFDLIKILDGIATRAPYMANRSHAAIRKFFNWCVARGKIDRSPADGLTAPTRERSRDRVLTEDELAAIVIAARQTAYPFGPVFELLALTGQRRDEVAGMRWSELNLSKSVWQIPKERTKNEQGHDVHLSERAVTLIESIPRFAFSEDSKRPANFIVDFVFTTTGVTSVSGFTKAKAALDKASEVTNWRIHDFRRTMATKMADLRIPIHVADAILNHQSRGMSAIQQIYQRSQFLDERRDALDTWSKYIEEIVKNKISANEEAA